MSQPLSEQPYLDVNPHDQSDSDQASAGPTARIVGVLGDLVDDIVVRFTGSLQIAADTHSTIATRQGGSGANVAVSVARIGGSSRFIGQVGEDRQGRGLVAELAELGVDPCVRFGGTTGSIVVLVSGDGERSFLSDRAAARMLDGYDEAWLDGLGVLHVPMYSLHGEPLASTAIDLVAAAHRRGVRVTVDASSTSIVRDLGRDSVIGLLNELRPEVLFCNRDEAAELGLPSSRSELQIPVVVLKDGPQPTLLDIAGVGIESVAPESIGAITDTTGAGDAFAAGFLVGLVGGEAPRQCVVRGHQCAAQLLRARANTV